MRKWHKLEEKPTNSVNSLVWHTQVAVISVMHVSTVYCENALTAIRMRVTAVSACLCSAKYQVWGSFTTKVVRNVTYVC
jgi:hypothetical protein